MNRPQHGTFRVGQVLPLWLLTLAVAFMAGRASLSRLSGTVDEALPAVIAESPPPRPAAPLTRETAADGSQGSSSHLASRAGRLAAIKATYVTPGLTHLERIRRLLAALDAMSPDELLDARREFEDLAEQGYSVNYEVNFVYWKLGEALGGRALEAITPSDTDGSTTEGLTRAMAAWATKEPANAVAWFNQLPDGKFRDEMSFWVVDGLCQRDPAEGARFFAGLPIETQREKLANMLWLQTHFGGAQGAQKWFTDHVEAAHPPEGASAEEFDAYRRSAFSQVSHRLAETSPAEAAAWVASKRGTPLFSVKVVGVVGEIWARTSPSEAEAWMESQATPASPQ